MEDIVLSCLESRVEENRNLYARFLVGPFLRGEALTVATALRRVLLSSAESIGITALYIQGITHEFSTMVGVRESVLELSLNFGAIVLSYDKLFYQKKSFFDKLQIGYLQVQGPKVIYANHLKLPLGIKLVDPTQYIATLSKEGSITLKFLIGKKGNFHHPNIGTESEFDSKTRDSTVFGEVTDKNIAKAKKTCSYKKGSTIKDSFYSTSRQTRKGRKGFSRRSKAFEIYSNEIKTHKHGHVEQSFALNFPSVNSLDGHQSLHCLKRHFLFRFKFAKRGTAFSPLGIKDIQQSITFCDVQHCFIRQSAKKVVSLDTNYKKKFFLPFSEGNGEEYMYKYGYGFRSVLLAYAYAHVHALRARARARACKRSFLRTIAKFPGSCKVLWQRHRLSRPTAFATITSDEKKWMATTLRQMDLLGSQRLLNRATYLMPFRQGQGPSCSLTIAKFGGKAFAQRASKLRFGCSVRACSFGKKFALAYKAKLYNPCPCPKRKSTNMLLQNNQSEEAPLAMYGRALHPRGYRKEQNKKSCSHQISLFDSGLYNTPLCTQYRQKTEQSENYASVHSHAHAHAHAHALRARARVRVRKKAKTKLSRGKEKAFSTYKRGFCTSFYTNKKNSVFLENRKTEKNKKLKFLSNSNVFKSKICLRNVIPLDLTLAPVLKVSFIVEIDDEVLYLRQKMRERIVLEVWTNGSINPRQAVHDSSLRLLDMFASFRSLYQASSK